MLSDFARAARDARRSIPTPPAPLQAIRDGVKRQTAYARTRALSICGALCLALITAGTGLGANVFQGIRIWLSGGTSGIAIRSFMLVHDPMRADLARVAANAAFPLVLPVGLPAGTDVTMLAYSPPDRPAVVMVQYENAAGGIAAGITLVESSTLGGNGVPLGPGAARLPARPVDHWRVGAETVIVPKGLVSAPLLQRMRAAMANATTASSVAATDALLPAFVVLDASPQLVAAAKRYAPSSGDILLGWPQVRFFGRVAARGEAFYDSHAVFLADIPSARGEPNYAKATLQWPKRMLLSRAAVRTVAKALAAEHLQDCGCAILVTQRNGTYHLRRISPR